MSGLIAIGSPGDDAESVCITSSTFWPQVDLTIVRETVRLDGTVTSQRLYHAAVDAISSVNRELRDWRNQHQQAGHSTLAAVPADQIDGTSELVMFYLRAVYATTSANLRERYRDFDATADGHKGADQLETPIDDLRRDARWAICDLRGIGRTTVELI